MRSSKKTKSKEKTRTWSSVFGAVGIAILAAAVAAFAASMLISAKGKQKEQPIVLKKVRVQVLNGCGVRGAGREMADELRLKGYDVIDVGNATTFDYRETIVIERQSANGRAREVARVLGVDNVVIQRVDGSPYDATVIIGKDFKSGRPE